MRHDTLVERKDKRKWCGVGRLSWSWDDAVAVAVLVCQDVSDLTIGWDWRAVLVREVCTANPDGTGVEGMDIRGMEKRVGRGPETSAQT